MDKLLEAVEIKRSNDDLDQGSQASSVVVYPQQSQSQSMDLNDTAKVAVGESIQMISSENSLSNTGSWEGLAPGSGQQTKAHNSTLSSAADLTRATTRSTTGDIQEIIMNSTSTANEHHQQKSRSKLPSINLLLNGDGEWSSSGPPVQQLREHSTSIPGLIYPYQRANTSQQHSGSNWEAAGQTQVHGQLAGAVPLTPVIHSEYSNPSSANGGFSLQEQQRSAQFAAASRYPAVVGTAVQVRFGGEVPYHGAPPAAHQQSYHFQTINAVQQSPQQTHLQRQYQHVTGGGVQYHPYQRPYGSSDSGQISMVTTSNRSSPRPGQQQQMQYPQHQRKSSSPQMIIDNKSPSVPAIITYSRSASVTSGDGNGSDRDSTKTGSKQKRNRRKFDQVLRLFQCNYGSCSKSYGTLNHLNHHITLQSHGPKRTIEEFDDVLMDAVVKGMAQLEDLPAHLKKSAKYEKLSGRIDGSSSSSGGGLNPLSRQSTTESRDSHSTRPSSDTDNDRQDISSQ